MPSITTTTRKGSSMSTTEPGRLSLYVAPDLVKALKHAAIEHGLSASRMCEAILREYFKAHPPLGYTPPTDTGDTQAERQLEQARRRARALRKNGKSYAAIAEQLNADGFTTATARPYSWQSARRLLGRR